MRLFIHYAAIASWAIAAFLVFRFIQSLIAMQRYRAADPGIGIVVGVSPVLLAILFLVLGTVLFLKSR